jgi:glycosyltransferase involved in cell wall biosynthesis
MLDFDRLISMAAKVAGDKPIAAAPYALPSVICRGLLFDGLISGYVADSSRDAVNKDPLIAGWWIDRSEGVWFLRRGLSRSIIFLSIQSDDEISGRMLLEARLKGFERVLVIAPDGSIAREINIASFLRSRLQSFPTKGGSSYENAFDEMFTLLGNRLHFPERDFDPKRVLIYTGSLQAGGAERQATNTALGLAKRWPGKIHVARSFEGGALDFYKPALDAAGIPTYVVSEDAKYSSPGITHIRNELATRYLSLGFLDIFYMIFHQALLIQKLKPGLVHTFQDYSNVLAGIAADLVGVPRLVLSGRSMAPDHFTIFQPYMAPGYHSLLKRRSVLLLNNSEAGAGDYARWLGYSRDRIHVIHNGFEFPKQELGLGISQRQMLGVPKTALLIGSIIGFREEKQPHLFLEMAWLLHNRYPHVHFVIFGEGTLLAASREFVESKNLSGVIHLPGATNDSWAALSAMDVFVLTSRLEGLPNVMIEAQAVGVPVVCTGAGGMSETFVESETGYSVPLATAEEFATTVGRLIDDSDLRMRMGATALRYARQTFDVDRMIDYTIEAYSNTPIIEGKEILPDWRLVDSPTDIRIGGALKDEGYCFDADLPAGVDASALCLWEDDHRLAPAHTNPRDIQLVGGGRYAILTNSILFSSSDSSDIRFNGRSYRLRPQNADPDFDEIIVSAEDITSEIGNCYIAHLGLGEGSARFGLWENTTVLGPGACLHDEVRTKGMGCYSLWGSDLYFSTSDNSDPRVNGRSYLLRRGRRASVLDEERTVGSEASVEHALQCMLSNPVTRDDFVPGRVVHVIGNLGPGGAERQALYTLTGLIKQPFESVQLLCYYLTASGNDFYLPAFTAAGVPVRAIRRQAGAGDPGIMPASLRKVRHALPQGFASDIADLFWEFISLRPEVVHSWLDGNNIRAGLAAVLAGVPRVIIAGRNLNPSHLDYLYEACMDATYKALLKLPQITMVNNSYAGRDDYASWLGIKSDRIIVIYNGCQYPTAPLDEARRRVRAANNLPLDAIVVGSVCRLSEEKRPGLFIEMARCALKVQQNLRFIFFGSGTLRDEMEGQIERLGISDSVKLMGITNNIWESLAAMDVFVLTSRVEGLPNVLIEAQCAGIPVVSTNVGGSPETFLDGKTGLGINTPTPETVAEAVLRLAHNPKLRQEMSTAAMAFARNKFGVPQMIARTMELYKRN